MNYPFKIDPSESLFLCKLVRLAALGASVYRHLCYSVLVCDTAAGGRSEPEAVVVKRTGLPRWSAVVTLRPLPCLASPLLLRPGQR